VASIFTSKSHRISKLADVSIFRNLPKKELAAVESHVTPLTIKAGTTLATQDRAPHQFVLLVSGEAKVVRNGRKIATVGPGDAIGELSLLDGGAQTASVVTTTDCEVLAVSVPEFNALLLDSPQFSRNLLKSVAGRVRSTLTAAEAAHH